MHRLLRSGLLVVVFVILLATAYLAGVGNMQTLRKDAYDAGYEAAIEERGLTPVVDIQEEEPPAPVAIVGVVTEVAPSGFTMTEEVAGSTEAGPERRILVATDGEIVMIIPKDPAVLARELAAYQRNTNGPLPMPEEQRAILVADLSPGDRVTVMTLDPDSDPIVAERVTRTAAASQ